MSYLSYEKVDLSYKDYKFKMDVKVGVDSVNVCIKCFGTVCIPSNDQCLMSITVKKSDEGHIATMSDFYNDLLRGANGASRISPKLSGAIYAVLCILLKQAQDQGILLSNDIVIVESKDFSQEDVQAFYERLGFTFSKANGTYMARVNGILGTCLANKDKISENLMNILKTI